MYIDDFIWFPNVSDKIEWKHGLSQSDVEELFFNQPRFRFIKKSGNKVLILSARNMDRKERKYHGRK